MRTRNLWNACVLAAAVSGTSVVAKAQNFSIAAADGSFVTGSGAVTLINNLAINNSGNWFVEVDTDGVSPGDGVLIKNGLAIHMQEGQPLPGAPSGGVTLSSFDAVNINNAGQFGGNIFLAGATTTTDSGVYQDANLVLQESSISTAPQFSAGTPYIGWFETKTNNSGQQLTMSSVDDPAITNTVDRAIVRWNIGPTGILLSETVLAKEGDTLPGHTQAAADFITGPHGHAFNDSGAAMFVVDGAGTTADDFAVYVNGALVAREGSPSPIAARNWGASGLGSSRVDMNNSGAYVHTGTLDATSTTDDLVIIKNGAKFRQEGDTLASIGGVFQFTAFGTSPVQIDDGGNVLWFGDWSDPDTTRDTGIFLNDQLIVQEGVTQIGGFTVFSIASGESAMHMSDNGQWVIFEGVLANPGGTNLDGAFVIQVPEPASMTAAIGMLALAAMRRNRRV